MAIVLRGGLATGSITPDALITTGPSAGATTDATTATFRFTSDSSPVSYRCSLDGHKFRPCSSPKSYSSLSLGSHTFEVEAVSAGGVTGVPAVRVWTIVSSSSLTGTATTAGTSGSTTGATTSSTGTGTSSTGTGTTGVVTYTDTTPPSAPINLAASDGDTQVSLRWSASTDDTGVTGYYIFRNGSLLGSAPGTSYTDTGLNDGTTYGYYVKAYDAAGNVSGASNTVSATPVASTSTAARLSWAPPVCGDATHSCQDLYLSNTGSNQTPSLSGGSDYRIHLPASGPLVGGLQIRGGHNVIIIGGEIDLAFPCSDASSACIGINVDSKGPGAVFVEGVWIHNSHAIGSTCPGGGMSCSTGDGIDVNDDPANASDITLENVRIDGISGCSGGADHADVFQPYDAANAREHIDHLTGVTNCQGLQVDPDLAWSSHATYPSEVIIKNTNVDVTPNPYSGDNNRYAYWLTYGTACNSGPITLTNDYASEPNGTLNYSAWPDIDQPAACKSVWEAPTLSFRNSPQISGTLTAGTPPAGDFVPPGTAGVNYTSPGYQ